MAAPGPWAQSVNGFLRRVPTWPLYLLGFAYMGWLFWRAATDARLVEPIDWLERSYGITSLQLVVTTLAVTPLRTFLKISLLKFRRALGLLVFFFVLAHFLVWAMLDVQALGAVWADILKRPYITIGMAAFVMLIPLAVTSNNASVRRLGSAGWRRVHWLTYPVAVLGATHYVWLARGFAIEPLVYLGLILLLLVTRLPMRRALQHELRCSFEAAGGPARALRALAEIVRVGLGRALGFPPLLRDQSASRNVGKGRLVREAP